MKIHTQTPRKHRSGFTLVEMIGVLAIVAILGSLLLPRVFNAINRAKINSSAMVLNTMKAAVTEAYSEKGQFTLANGSAVLPANLPLDYDADVLLPRQFVNQEFSSRIGVDDADSEHQIILAAPDAGAVDGIAVAWDLDGDATGSDSDGDGTPDQFNDIATHQFAVYAYIPNVSIKDAIDLSNTVDGTDLSVANEASGDALGRVIYAAPAGGTTDIMVYLVSR